MGLGRLSGHGKVLGSIPSRNFVAGPMVPHLQDFGFEALSQGCRGVGGGDGRQQADKSGQLAQWSTANRGHEQFRSARPIPHHLRRNEFSSLSFLANPALVSQIGLKT